MTWGEHSLSGTRSRWTPFRTFRRDPFLFPLDKPFRGLASKKASEKSRPKACGARFNDARLAARALAEMLAGVALQDG
jgi:hypothetical protein